MKIIFLDIDGVLYTGDVIRKRYIRVKSLYEEGQQIKFQENSERFCPRSMRNLKEILEKTDAQIVLSSTWRLGKTLDDQIVIQREFKKYGIDFDLFIDKTPYLCTSRGNEIAVWLGFHPEVKSMVIIDDDSDMDQYNERHLAKCHFTIGITDDVKHLAINILNTERGLL
jgi:hypothetical protein